MKNYQLPKINLISGISDKKENNFVFGVTEDGRYLNIPFDEANTDYQAYLKFLEDGGIPLPAENT